MGVGIGDSRPTANPSTRAAAETTTRVPTETSVAELAARRGLSVTLTTPSGATVTLTAPRHPVRIRLRTNPTRRVLPSARSRRSLGAEHHRRPHPRISERSAV